MSDKDKRPLDIFLPVKPGGFFGDTYTTGSSEGGTTAAVTADSLLAMMAKLKAAPKLLSVIYATPGGIACLPKASPGPPHPLEKYGLWPSTIGGVRIVELPTVAECQDACRLAIEAGRRAAVLTEDTFFDPVEAAREFAEREKRLHP